MRDKIYDMELHERCVIYKNDVFVHAVIRVHQGWIYTMVKKRKLWFFEWEQVNQIFVPFFEEKRIEVA